MLRRSIYVENWDLRSRLMQNVENERGSFASSHLTRVPLTNVRRGSELRYVL